MKDRWILYSIVGCAALGAAHTVAQVIILVLYFTGNI